MSTQNQLKILKQGAKAWNPWRIENPTIKISLSRANLSRAILSRVNLSGANLSGANLSEANLSGADLSGADLSGAYLSEAKLSEANLNGANLSGADLHETNLGGANLVGADLREVKLSRVKLRGANLSEVDLSEVDLRGTNLIGAYLSRANLHGADLSGADLSRANLHGADLSGADLNGADLNGADLNGADLSGADLSGADLSGADLSRADLSRADLSEVSLSEVNLRGASLRGVNLRGVDLSGVDLSRADLSGVDLSGANLSEADLSKANLSNASLIAVQALATDFSQAILTGVCIQDWHINAQTNLQDASAGYVYFSYDTASGSFSNRRPHDLDKLFAAGEFVALVQKSLETVDLIFVDGIDWKAFFQSFQQLQQKYRNDSLGIQAIEKKNNAFVIRLEVASDADKALVEQDAKTFYENQIRIIEAQYRKQLQLQGVTISQAQETIKSERREKAALLGIISTMANNQGPSYDLRGAKFGGGFAADGGLHVGGTFNDFSTNVDNNLNDITQLIQTLRQLSQTFPEPQQGEATDHLDDLENDLQQRPEKRKPSRFKATLAALLALSMGIGGVIATATDFTNNVLELSEKLGIVLVKPHTTQEPGVIDVKLIEPHL